MSDMLDKVRQKLNQEIVIRGNPLITFVMAHSDAPGYTYTTGLTELSNDHELLVVGFPPQVAFMILEQVLKKNRRDSVRVGSYLTLDYGIAVTACEMPKENVMLAATRLRYDDSPLDWSVLQLVVSIDGGGSLGHVYADRQLHFHPKLPSFS